MIILSVLQSRVHSITKRYTMNNMLPNTRKSRNTYLERYHLRKEMAECTGDDLKQRMLLPPIKMLKSLSTPQRNRFTSGAENNSKTNPDSSSVLQKRVKQLLQDSETESTPEQSASFTEMMHSFKNTLPEFERDCLGFCSDEPTDCDVNFEDQSRDRANNNENGTSPIMEQLEDDHDVVDESNDEDEDSASSWSKLMEVLNPKNWVSSEPNGSSNAENVVKKQSDDNIEEDDNVNVHDLLHSGLLALIEKPCEGNHADGINNCFICQHKDSLRTFTTHYIDELENIWRNRDLLKRKERDQTIIQTLGAWIYNLSEQSLSLAEAYDESVKASEKLKSVLLQSRNSMRILQKQHDKDKSINDGLTYELSLQEQTITNLKGQFEMEHVKTADLKRSLHEAQSDVNSLTELIIRLRDNGVWDIHGLPIGDTTFQKIFNDNYYLHGSKVIKHKELSTMKREWKNEIETLKTEADVLRAIIASKDREVERYKKFAETEKKQMNQ